MQELAAIAAIGINGICHATQITKGVELHLEQEELMSKKAADHHRKAAQHLEQAAMHHKEAAKQHETGRHEKAAHHAHLARGHQEHAAREAAEAAEEYILIYPAMAA